MTSPIPIRAVALAWMVVTGMACAASTADSPSATGSGGAGGCLTSACVPVLSTPVSWAFEIDPPSNSSTAALTELLGVNAGAPSLKLSADSQTPVNATFTAAASGTVPSTANVVLTFASQIGGRPSLTFESAAMVDTSMTTATATLILPEGVVTNNPAATLQLIPLSPADQASPPLSFAVALAPTLQQETLPASYLSIGGTLLSALGAPATSFVARAFQSGTQVSNAPVTGSDGTFQLLLAPTAAGGSVIVELTPQNQGGSDPWYTSAAVSPGTNLGPIMLPAYSSPNAFTLTVEGADDPTATVGGALVRAQAILGSSAAGATDFVRTGTTASDGTVNLSLLPGTATTALDYNLTVIPPAGALYATRCIGPVGVTGGGPTNAPVSLLTVALSRRPVLTGRVSDAGGAPVANVAITATAGPLPTDTCSNTPAVSTNGHADANGDFSLPLDPGTYQLDYDPPAGAPVPRLTEQQTITISAGGIQLPPHNVTLPAPALVQGTILGPDQSTPLASATVRIFEVSCTGQGDCAGATPTPPALLAQTVTDANGKFQAVVAAPPAAGN